MTDYATRSRDTSVSEGLREFKKQEAFNEAVEWFSKGIESELEFVRPKDKPAERERLLKEVEANAAQVADAVVNGADFLGAIADVQEIQRQQMHGTILEKDKQAYLSGGRDKGFVLPEDARYYDGSAPERSVPQNNLVEFAQREAAKFADQNPDYYQCQENFKAITDFIVRQGIWVPTASTFKAAWMRLRQFGLIKERPVEVAPEIPAAPEPTAQEKYEARQKEYREGKFLQGLDGVWYSEMQVDKMSADELKTLLPVVNSTAKVGSGPGMALTAH